MTKDKDPQENPFYVLLQDLEVVNLLGSFERLLFCFTLFSASRWTLLSAQNLSISQQLGVETDHTEKNRRGKSLPFEHQL